MARKRRRSLLGFFSIAVTLGFGWAGVAPVASVHAADPFPEGPGKAEFIKVCTQCHAAEAVATLRLSKDDWRDLVFDMKGKGAEATDEECNLIVEYLAKNFPADSKK